MSTGEGEAGVSHGLTFRASIQETEAEGHGEREANMGYLGKFQNSLGIM